MLTWVLILVINGSVYVDEQKYNDLISCSGAGWNYAMLEQDYDKTKVYCSRSDEFAKGLEIGKGKLVDVKKMYANEANRITRNANNKDPKFKEYRDKVENDLCQQSINQTPIGSQMPKCYYDRLKDAQ